MGACGVGANSRDSLSLGGRLTMNGWMPTPGGETESSSDCEKARSIAFDDRSARSVSSFRRLQLK